MVTVIPTANNRCSIEFHLGNSYTVHHIKPEMVQPFVLRTLKSAVLRFARLVLEDLEEQPNCPNKFSRTGAGHAFQYGIHGIDSWDAERLASHIRLNEGLILNMLPRPTGPGYQKLSQLAFDILLIASQKTLAV